MDILKKKEYTEISNSVKELVSAGSVFKGKLFRCMLNASDVGSSVFKDYLSTVRNMIKEYAEYAEAISEAAKAVSDSDDVVITTQYDDIKDLLYTDYDYASMLLFADGVIKGIDDKKFEDEDDIEDFFEHTTEKAFKDRADSTAGLLDDVSDIVHTGSRDKAEASLFKSVKRQRLFDKSDSKELYRSADKVCNFLAQYLTENKKALQLNAKLIIAMINYIVEYMSYSVVAYATRVYAIGAYVYQFTVPSRENPITEDVNTPEEDTSMREAMDAMVKDIKRAKETENFMCKWLSALGVEDAIEKNKEGHDSYEVKRSLTQSWNSADQNKNAFFQKTIANPLREYLMSSVGFSPYLYDEPIKLRDDLNNLLHNEKQSITSTSSPKQDLLAAIRTTVPENKTEAGYKQLASDLVLYTMNMLLRISKAYQSTSAWISDWSDSAKFKNDSLLACNEASKMLEDLYSELANAMLMKARDIELCINDINNAAVNKKISDLSIKVPGSKKSDNSSNDNIMMGVPDTTRASVDLGMYALPKMESLEMYDEYLQTAMGFDGDPYFEAFDSSTIFNAIQALLAAIKKKASQFFDGQKFKVAVNWCNQHQAELTNASYQGQMDVLPYKDNLNLSIVDAMIGALNKVRPENLKTDADVDKFILDFSGYNVGFANIFIAQNVAKQNQGVTPNQQNTKQAEQTRNNQAMNFILFGTEKDQQPVTIKNDGIKQNMSVWLDNVGHSQDTYRELNQKLTQMDNELKSLKQRIVSAQNTNNTSNTNTSGNPAGNTNANNNQSGANANQGQNQNNNNQQQNQNNDADARTRNLLVNIQRVETMAWNCVYNAITKCIKDQYSYIQQAYQLRTNQQ